MRNRRQRLNMALASLLTLAMLVTSSLWAAPIHAQATSGELTDDEVAGLQFMREEEKLARDVYLTLDETWDLRVFQNISRAEQTHMDTVATLLDRYDIEDPAADNEFGIFTNPDLQALYDQLVAQGNESLEDALRVGAAIEEIDILDLEERLLRGSTNHLRAFVANLERQTGETYEPQYMGQAAYDELMADVADGRGRSRGSRQSGRGQRGNGPRR